MKKIIIDGLDDKKKKITVGKNSELTYVLVSTAGQGKKDVDISLSGQGANVQILGIIIGKKGQATIHTLQHHTAPDTQSDLLIKSVMFGPSSLSYDGLIKIDPGAQKSNAYQRNENLLMSDRATVDTRPELEIQANDVRCTHGATIGKIDEEILFYLMSRGIDRKEAERLVIKGFFEPVLERIPDIKMVEKLRLKIQSELDKIDG